MLHSDVLKLLTPVQLEGVAAADLATEGAQLDKALDTVNVMLGELFPAGAYETLVEWERVYGVTAALDDPLQLRRNRVIQKMRDLGRLDIAYFVALAAGLGFQVVIEELHPFMAGWGYAGDELGSDDSDWCWRVYYSDIASGYYFRAGESAAGEYLSYNYASLLQELFIELKPADTFVEFVEA